MKCFNCGGPIDPSLFEDELCETCLLEALDYEANAGYYDDDDEWEDDDCSY